MKSVPNKTIYVSDGDLPLYHRAQELAGDNLSAAIASALKRYVELEEGRLEGFDEVIVKVGLGAGRRVRFSGLLLGEWGSTANDRYETWKVYRTRTGKFAVHHERSPAYTMTDASGQRAKGWRATYLGIGVTSFGTSTGDATLEVVDSVEALQDKIPEQLYAMVAEAAASPVVEDLDI
jgi:EXLDI family protein